MQDLQYGVIQYDDLVRDLTHWETMLVSTMMQRPIKTIVNNEQIWESQAKNLKSAVYRKLSKFNFLLIQFALAALRTQDGATEHQLYENIVSIPHYNQKQMHSLVDKEDEKEVVDKKYEKF